MSSYPIVGHFPGQRYEWFTLVRFDPIEALQGISYHILYHSSKEVH